jgi:N-acetylmuramoyl-L-alanine amidase
MINSNKLAIDIQKGMLLSLRKKYSRIKDGGVRPAPFWVLVGTQMPAILIETGYLTNPLESKRLFNPEYQKNLAKGIAEGIKSYFKKNP